MAEKHASVKRKVYQWLLKMFQDDALGGHVQALDAAPDVADLVELLRGAGYRLSAVDIGANTSTTSTNASAFSSASAATPGCNITIKCPRSGLAVTMEAAGKAECHCPDTPAEDHSASTWSVVSSQENLSRLEAVGSSLLPPVPGDVSEVVGSTVRCAVRILREWPSARAPPPLAAQAPPTTQGPRGSLTPQTPSTPLTPLSESALPPVPRRPAPPPPDVLAPLRRPLSANFLEIDTAVSVVGRRRHYRSLDAVQWSASGARDTPTPPLVSPWAHSVSPMGSLGPSPTPPYSQSPLPMPDERAFPFRPRHSHSPPRRQSQGQLLPQRSRSEEPPPVPPRTRRSSLFTLDDYLAVKRAERMQLEQRFAPERSQSANDIDVTSRRLPPSESMKKWGVSEPPSLTTLQETREVKGNSGTPERPLIAMTPKGSKVIINDATDFVTKAELTMRQIGCLIQSVKNWMVASVDEPEMTERLVKYTAKDSTDSDSSEESIMKPTPKSSSKKGVKRLIPTLSGKQKATGTTPRPTGPSSRFSDSHHPKLARTFMTKAVVEAVPTQTFVRPKKREMAKDAGMAALIGEQSRSGSDGSERGSVRRRTIAGTSLPGTQRRSGGSAQPRAMFTTAGSRGPASPVASSRAAASSVARSAVHVATSTSVAPSPRSVATAPTRSLVSVAASSAANVAASVAARMRLNAAARARVADAKSKGAIPRLPRNAPESQL